MQVNPYRYKDYPVLLQDKPVQAKDIARQFKENPLDAKKHYSEKRMLVEGVVKYNGPDMFGLPSLELSDSIHGETDALCVFNDESSIQNVQIGDTVTIQANFIGCAPDYGPTFKKCEIVERRS